jgi:hypothetical protein
MSVVHVAAVGATSAETLLATRMKILHGFVGEVQTVTLSRRRRESNSPICLNLLRACEFNGQTPCLIPENTGDYLVRRLD